MGDVIKEVNGIPVGTPEQLMDIIRSTDQGITLKIVQNFTEHQPQAQVSVHRQCSHWVKILCVAMQTRTYSSSHQSSCFILNFS